MSCVTRILVLRGNSVQRLAFTPLSGELVWDTDSKEMFVGDGSTLGGIPLSNLTTEQIQDIIGGLIGDSTTIDVTYDDSGNVLTMDVITTALDHAQLIGVAGTTNTHAQIDSHIANTANPHVVTLTQAINEDGGTDVTVAEIETLTDGSDASALHNHNAQYYTQSQIDAAQLIQDNAISQNASDISDEITDRSNADTVLQNQITNNDNDISQNASDISDNETAINDHIADVANPHAVTITQAITEDAGTDITVVELETLSDTSDAGALHHHDLRYKKEFWQGSQATDQTNILSAGTNLVIAENITSLAATFTLAGSELTISKTGIFKFSINIAGDTETGARETLRARLQRDSGGGFIDIPASEGVSEGYSYHRNNASGEDSISISTMLNVTTGDKFRVLMTCPTSATGSGIKTISAGTGMIVEEK